MYQASTACTIMIDSIICTQRFIVDQTIDFSLSLVVPTDFYG